MDEGAFVIDYEMPVGTSLQQTDAVLRRVEALLLENGSKQKDLWGINLYPDLEAKDFLEYDSMINIRPSQNNRSRGVDDAKIREKIAEIVTQRILP